MSHNELLAMLSLAGMFGLFCFGFPIAYTMLFAGLLFGFLGIGKLVFYLLTVQFYQVMSDTVQVAIPFFLIMGYLLEGAGLMERLFSAFQKLFARLPGSLYMAVISTGTIFAAATGIVGSSVNLLCVMAEPTMRKGGYDIRMGAGSIAASGTLGILIPPSIMLVFMGSAANVSVGKLFYGAMTPGVLVGVAYIVYVKVISIVKKDYAPPMPEEVLSRYSKKQIAWGIVVNVLPVAIVIFSVLGAIWFGWCPATEAAALGVAASFIIALCTHSINKQVIKKTLVESIKLTSMVYAVSAFGNLFVTVFMRLGCSSAVTSLFVNLPFGKWGIFALMMAVVFLLGFLMDWIAVCMITIPIFVPIATQVGFQAEYFLTMMAVIMQPAFLSPPMAASIFYFQGVAKDHITTAETIRGVWPFMGLQVLVFILCIIFPQIVTWLPNMIIS